VDSSHASPIQHPYVWSSLGASGAEDAYRVKLGITFAAQYRVSVNGNGTGGWLSSDFPHPVLVTHRWLRPEGGGPQDEPRTPLPAPIAPGGAAGVRMRSYSA